MNILSIESSCDETAAAVISGAKDGLSVLSDIVSSQIELHSGWGGVVPNLAAREHLKNILPVIDRALKKAGLEPQSIDLISVTNGPGLIPALLIGTSTAKTLSYLWKKPLIGIHHIEGHIYANFITDEVREISNFQFPIFNEIQNSKFKNSKTSQITGSDAISHKLEPKNYSPDPAFPLLCLVVSGGHTQLVLMKKHLDYEIVGQTLDDAAGEAFDKVARILGLGYPGGPEIARQAEIHVNNLKNHKLKTKSHDISLPRPMLDSPDFNFSFSGLKTAVLYLVKKNERFVSDPEFFAHVAHEFQQSVVDVLVKKTMSAAAKYAPGTIMLAGGVSANRELRNRLQKAIEENYPDISYRIPDPKYSIDNAAMIGAAAFFRFQKMKNKKELSDNWKNLRTDANLELK